MAIISQSVANTVANTSSTVDAFLMNRYYANVIGIQWENVNRYVTIDYLNSSNEYPYPVYFNGVSFPTVNCYFDYSDEITEVQNLHTDLLQIISTFQGAVTNIGADDISFVKGTYTHIDTLFDNILNHFLSSNKLYAHTDVNGTRSQCVIQLSPTSLATPLDFSGTLFPVYAKSPLSSNEVQDIQKNAQTVNSLLDSAETDNVIDNLPNVSGSGNVGQSGGGSIGLTSIPTIETGTTGLLTLINRLYLAQNNNSYTIIKRSAEAASKANKILYETQKILGNLTTIYNALKAYHQSENNSLADTNSYVHDIRLTQDNYHQSENDSLYTISQNVINLQTSLQIISDYINTSNQTIYTNLQTIADNIVTVNALQSGLQQIISDSDTKYNDIVQRLSAIENRLP